ncbi:MAG TPA: CBS domain-containing protein, partial [Polyangia bacterium]
MGKRKVRTLPIRTRKIVSAEGEASLARSVLCPTHGEAVGLSVCAECVRCESIDEAGVRCVPELAQPTMRWSPLLRRMLPSAADRVAISDVMSRDVTCTRADVTIETLTTLLLDANIGAVPVVDAEGFPVGILSKSDLVREHWENGDTQEVTDEVIDGVHLKAVAPRTVRDLMMPIAFT